MEREEEERKIEEGEISICDFLQQTERARAMEECGCALCQLVAEQCGNIVQFGPQSRAGMQTQMHKHSLNLVHLVSDRFPT